MTSPEIVPTSTDPPAAAAEPPVSVPAEPSPATAAVASLTDPCFRLDAGWVIRWANPPADALLGRFVTPVLGSSARSAFADAFGATFDRAVQRALRTGQPVSFEEQYLPLDTWLEVHLYPEADGVTVMIHDAADRRRGAQLLEDQTRLLERIARGEPTAKVLDAVTGLVERHAAGSVCAVFAVNPTGTSDGLRLAAAPGFAPEYAADLDPAVPAADAPPVGLAAFTGKPVTVADLLAEPAGSPFRAAALAHGFRAVWAVPLASADHALLGVLGVWRREPGRPVEPLAALLRAASHLAGIALERSRAEADLRQKEQEYRAIFETVQDGLIVTDAQGFVAEANPAACRLHGSARDALVGRPAADLVRPDYHGVLRRLLDEVRQGREFHGELACTRRDGSSFPAELTAVALAYKGQRHVLAVVRDVTSRKGMEDDLRRSEERLRTVANAAPLVLFSLDRSGVFTLSEGQALAALGLRPGEVVGRNAMEMYRDHPSIVEHLRLALSGEPQRWVVELGERVFQTTARPIRSPRGEIVGISGVGVDVTEQTMAVDAMRESEERFRASFNQSPIAVAHATLDGRILRASDRLAATLGTTPDALVGRRLDEWYEAPDRADDDADVTALLSGEAREAVHPRVLRRADRTAVEATVGVSLVRGRVGEPKHLILMVTPK